MSLENIAISEYAKRLTPIVAPNLQLLLDETIYRMLKTGICGIQRDNTGALVASESVTTFGAQLNAIEPDDLAVFITTWDNKPLVTPEAKEISMAYSSMRKHLGLEISTAGHALRYLNNVAQIRKRDSDKWQMTAPQRLDGREIFTIEKDGDGQTATMNQLAQSSAQPFTDTMKELLQQFTDRVPLPAGIGIGDGTKFEGEIERLRPRIEQSVNEFSKRLNPGTNNAAGFVGFFDPTIRFSADSATADGLLKQAQAEELTRGKVATDQT